MGFSPRLRSNFVLICMSAQTGDGSFQTFCENIHQDNDIYGLTGDPFCIIAVGQDVVSDGCHVIHSGGGASGLN